MSSSSTNDVAAAPKTPTTSTSTDKDKDKEKKNARATAPPKNRGSSRLKTVNRRNSARKNVSPNVSIDNTSQEGNSNRRPVVESPRGKKEPQNVCRVCNYRPEKGKGGFFKKAFKKTFAMLRQSDTDSPTLNASGISDTEAEYSDIPGSVDMYPIPMFFKMDEVEQERLRNKTFKKDGTVFHLNRPWWTIRDRKATPPYQPIQQRALENLFLKDPSLFVKTPARKVFFDALGEDIESLKAVDQVHNGHNVVISNTFYSGVNVLAQKHQKLGTDSRPVPPTSNGSGGITTNQKKRSNEGAPAQVLAQIIPKEPKAKKVIKWADEPFFLHQYSRKDRFTEKRYFSHVEYGRRVSKEGKDSKDSAVASKGTKKGLVFD
ncbi:unnamed protein product [Caenorhabditis sp. 36 PRJEB53466]|nr:unnamed protein product [Caenorhabditis sp. 36 PRJEB53466]